MFPILTVIIAVIINNDPSTGAMKSQPVHSNFSRDSENWHMTSKVVQPNRLLNFSLEKKNGGHDLP